MNSASKAVPVPAPESLTQDWAGHTLDMIGALILVIAAVMVVSVILRHLQQRSFGNTDHMRIIQALSIGTKDRVLLVQVGVDQILLGVSAAGITHVHTLSKPVVFEEADETAIETSFAKTIRALASK